MTLERVRVCKRDGELLATPHELPGTDEHGLVMSEMVPAMSTMRQTEQRGGLRLATHDF